VEVIAGTAHRTVVTISAADLARPIAGSVLRRAAGTSAVVDTVQWVAAEAGTIPEAGGAANDASRAAPDPGVATDMVVVEIGKPTSVHALRDVLENCPDPQTRRAKAATPAFTRHRGF
jgi:hypothetical protein